METQPFEARAYGLRSVQAAALQGHLAQVAGQHALRSRLHGCSAFYRHMLQSIASQAAHSARQLAQCGTLGSPVGSPSRRPQCRAPPPVAAPRRRGGRARSGRWPARAPPCPRAPARACRPAGPARGKVGKKEVGRNAKTAGQKTGRSSGTASHLNCRTQVASARAGRACAHQHGVLGLEGLRPALAHPSDAQASPQAATASPKTHQHGVLGPEGLGLARHQALHHSAHARLRQQSALLRAH